MTKARDIADFKFENIVDTGTEGTKVATGTTAQRGSTAGQLRFNTTTGLAEYYTGSAFKSIDSPPTVSSVGSSNITQTQIDSGYDLSITGSNFSSGATVKFIGADNTEYASPTVTVNSDSSITARVHSSVSNANEPFSVKVTNVSGLSNTLESAFNVDAKPAWQTASGSLGTILEGNAISVSATATDPENDAISYSETGGTVLSTNGLTLNSSTGVITGTAPTVANNTTLSFNLRATSGTQSTDRAFSIGINDLESSLQNPLTTSGAFGWGNAQNFSWSHSSGTGNFGTLNQVIVDGQPATSSDTHGDTNSFQQFHGSGDGWIGVDLGSGRSLKVYRTMVMGWGGSHYCLNNYVKGSNDGSNWTDIVTWSAHPDNGGNYNRGYLLSQDNSNFKVNYLNTNKENYWITCTNNNAYRYFRLGGSGWNVSNEYQIVSEWWLWGLEG